MIAMTLGNGFDDSSAFMKSQTLDCLASLSGSRISSAIRKISSETIELYKILCRPVTCAGPNSLDLNSACEHCIPTGVHSSACSSQLVPTEPLRHL